MAKRISRKKSRPTPSNVPDWASYFDPRNKKLLPQEMYVNLATIGFDPNMFKAIWITHLIVKEVLKGVKSVGNKTANPAAMAEWREKLQAAIYVHLDQNNGDWDADGANVLTVAFDMGTIAGLLAGTKPEAGINQLKSAFAASKSHTTCSAGAIGGGAWCSFGWF